MIIDHTGPTSNLEFCLIPVGGFGNRLLAIASGLRLLDKNYYGKMTIHWITNDEIGTKLNEIITINGNIHEAPPHPNSPTLPLGALPTIRVPTHNKLNICHFSLFRSIEDHPTTDLTTEYKTALQRIQYHPDIQTQANTINTTNLIGIHCRRTDYWTHNQETAAKIHTQLDKNITTYIKTHHPNEQIFLSTDSPYTLAHLQNELKNQIIHYPKTHYPIWTTRNPQTTKEAIIDHLLLSKCKKIIADSTSTFSQTAAWIGLIDKEQI
jgi:hypothetical protein